MYADPSAVTLDLRAVATYVRRTTGLATAVREEFFHHHSADLGRLAGAIAAARVTDVTHPWESKPAPPPLVDFERRLLETPEHRVPGVLYDGLRLQAIYRSALPPNERTLRIAHIALTSRLPGTFDDADRRYHARAVILGYPGLVSTSGLVEAPAKPRGFYAAKRAMRIESADARYEVLKERYAGQFVDYDDARLSIVVRGYVLQPLFYHMTGEPFCDDEACILFNAHWQEEMLRAQVESGSLCARHREVAEALRRRRAPMGRLTGGKRTRRR